MSQTRTIRNFFSILFSFFCGVSASTISSGAWAQNNAGDSSNKVGKYNYEPKSRSDIAFVYAGRFFDGDTFVNLEFRINPEDNLGYFFFSDGIPPKFGITAGGYKVRLIGNAKKIDSEKCSIQGEIVSLNTCPFEESSKAQITIAGMKFNIQFTRINSEFSQLGAIAKLLYYSDGSTPWPTKLYNCPNYGSISQIEMISPSLGVPFADIKNAKLPNFGSKYSEAYIEAKRAERMNLLNSLMFTKNELADIQANEFAKQHNSLYAGVRYKGDDGISYYWLKEALAHSNSRNLARKKISEIDNILSEYSNHKQILIENELYESLISSQLPQALDNLYVEINKLSNLSFDNAQNLLSYIQSFEPCVKIKSGADKTSQFFKQLESALFLKSVPTAIAEIRNASISAKDPYLLGQQLAKFNNSQSFRVALTSIGQREVLDSANLRVAELEQLRAKQVKAIEEQEQAEAKRLALVASAEAAKKKAKIASGKSPPDIFDIRSAIIRARLDADSIVNDTMLSLGLSSVQPDYGSGSYSVVGIGSTTTTIYDVKNLKCAKLKGLNYKCDYDLKTSLSADLFGSNLFNNNSGPYYRMSYEFSWDGNSWTSQGLVNSFSASNRRGYNSTADWDKFQDQQAKYLHDQSCLNSAPVAEAYGLVNLGC